jgi:hypothetical protein
VTPLHFTRADFDIDQSSTKTSDDFIGVGDNATVVPHYWWRNQSGGVVALNRPQELSANAVWGVKWFPELMTIEGIEVSGGTVTAALWAMHEAHRLLPPPDVSVMENGTILLFWLTRLGFVNLEVGESEFGVIARAEGRQSFRLNAPAWALPGVIAERLAPFFGLSPRLPRPSEPYSGVRVALPADSIGNAVAVVTA